MKQFMKIKILYVFLATSLLFSSCKDWLEAGSSTQLKGDKLFETEEGFENALTGIYLNMASANMYGKNMTWFFVDLMGQPYYNFGTTDVRTDIFQGKYYTTRTQPYVDNIWSASYNTIANINNVLKYIDKNGDNLMGDATQNMYKGELLGLRAYIHFDLMRLFGYGNLQSREDYQTRMTIPYVTDYSKQQTPQRTFPETIGLIIKDLEDASKYLINDPITNNNVAPEISSNTFFSKETRRSRMNYYAAQATLARVYMWEGSDTCLQKAYDIAKTLTQLEGTAYKWVEQSAIANNVLYPDLTFSTEHLFRLDVFNFKDIVNSSMVDLNTNSTNVETNVFTEYNIEQMIVNTLKYDYDLGDYVTDIGRDDYRYSLHYKRVSKSSTGGSDTYYYMPYKYRQIEYSPYLDMLPMIKISEMYYIMAEYELRNGSEDAALDIINTVRLHRGMTEPITEDIINNDWWSSVEDELTKEYMKEFVGEGQLFYYIKRKGYTNPLYIYNEEFTDSKYLLPYPSDETILGWRVQ